MHCAQIIYLSAFKLLVLGSLLSWGRIVAESPEIHDLDGDALTYFETYCFDCHDGDVKKGDLDLTRLLTANNLDKSVVFENLITGNMPPAKKKQPTEVERETMLHWLSSHQAELKPAPYRRISRHEFVQSANDLLGIDLDLTGNLSEDRGTYDFDVDRRVQITKEMLGSYFGVIQEMLDFALPKNGFETERIWVTNKIKDSHHTYNIYTRPFEEGILFSWTRANNGNSYSFFYDHFDPPVKGWYELSFDAKKVGDFPEDVSLMVFAGKYYFADDRPQPQRLLDVISLGNDALETFTIRAFLHPGESVSVHCPSKHNFRQKNGEKGAYIRQLQVRGPIKGAWPPTSYQKIFDGLTVTAPERKAQLQDIHHSNLEAIGGSITVSSQQEGMEKEKMQDGSNRTFWHSRFSPTLAKPPHFVILENPNNFQIDGLTYSTWSGGNGNGQVKAYEIYVSDDGESWGEPIMTGHLEIRLANQQFIHFPRSTRKRFIRFLVTDAFSLDDRFLASIGRLDVITELAKMETRIPVSVSSTSDQDFRKVIRRFAERAFSTRLTGESLEPYVALGLDVLHEQGDFVEAAKIALKAVLGSHRFLMAPGEHANPSYQNAASLARMIWLSVPDDMLMELASKDQLRGKELESQIERMLLDEKGKRMIHSFSQQWLRLHAFKKVTPSLKLYPLYDDLLNHYLPMETEMFLGHLIHENLPVDHLIDSNFSFLNQRLAQHYGIEDVIGQQMRKMELAADSPRGGILTMGSVMKVTANGFDTSPILRGAWISKNVVGNTLSPPPEEVEVIEPKHDEEAVTLREQIEQHKTHQVCRICHKAIDPYGFAFESFDATGQWRDQYRIKMPHRGTFQYRMKGYYQLGQAVDASGEIGGELFEDVFGFKKILLSNHKKIAYNFVKKFFEYANGYKPSLNQRLDLYSMIPNESKDCRMKDLVTKTLIYSITEERR